MTSDTFSVPSPIMTACKSAGMYYDPGTTVEGLERVIGVAPGTGSRVSRRSLIAVSIIATWGMRAAEYLSAVAGDVMENDMLLIGGRKGSASYRVLLSGITSQFQAARIECPGRLVSGTTYIEVYRACVKLGVGVLIDRHKHASRTHLYRHLVADQVRERGETVVGDLLHHRSPKSQAYYGVNRR